jgi:hypothetical protein
MFLLVAYFPTRVKGLNQTSLLQKKKKLVLFKREASIFND